MRDCEWRLGRREIQSVCFDVAISHFGVGTTALLAGLLFE